MVQQETAHAETLAQEKDRQRNSRSCGSRAHGEDEETKVQYKVLGTKGYKRGIADAWYQVQFSRSFRIVKAPSFSGDANGHEVGAKQVGTPNLHQAVDEQWSAP